MNPVSRRNFLQVTGAAGLAVASLAACSGNPAGTTPSGTGSGAAPWPTFQPGGGAEPDLRSTIEGGGADAFYRYPDSTVATVSEVPGDGSGVTCLVPTYSPPPSGASSNAMWSAINDALGLDVQLSLVPIAEYRDRLATVTASNDLPDAMMINNLPRAKQFVQARCADLTEYLSGDAILEYPNLAAIPTYAWQAMGRVGEGIYGVPLPRGRQPAVLHVNRTVLDGVGAPDPWNRDQFVEAMRASTGDGRYGLGAAAGSNFAMEIWAGAFGAPNRWQVVDGEFVLTQTTEEYRATLEFLRDLWSEGLYHPGSQSLSQNDLISEYYAQSLVSVPDNFTNYSTGLHAQRIGDRFETDIAPIFAPDYTNWLGSGIFAYTVFRDAEPDRIRMLLRMCDYLAAPYGSKEWELVNLGVEGDHFTRSSDGAIELTDLADAENGNTVPFKYIADSMDVIQVPGNEDATRRAFEFFETVVPAGTTNPAIGLDSDTLDREGATVEQTWTDAIIAIVTGREDIDTWDGVVDRVMNGSGGAIATELAEAYADREDS